MRNPAAQGRPDANHTDVVRWYEQCFCSVIDCHSLGMGVPDLIVGCGGLMRSLLGETAEGSGDSGSSRVL